MWRDHQHTARLVSDKVKHGRRHNQCAVTELDLTHGKPLYNFIIILDICHERYWACDAGEGSCRCAKGVQAAASNHTLLETGAVVAIQPRDSVLYYPDYRGPGP